MVFSKYRAIESSVQGKYNKANQSNATQRNTVQTTPSRTHCHATQALVQTLSMRRCGLSDECLEVMADGIAKRSSPPTDAETDAETDTDTDTAAAMAVAPPRAMALEELDLSGNPRVGPKGRLALGLVTGN